MKALLEAMMYKHQLLYDTSYIYIYIYINPHNDHDSTEFPDSFIHTYRPSLLAGLLGGILCPTRANTYTSICRGP